MTALALARPPLASDKDDPFETSSRRFLSSLMRNLGRRSSGDVLHSHLHDAQALCNQTFPADRRARLFESGVGGADSRGVPVRLFAQLSYSEFAHLLHAGSLKHGALDRACRQPVAHYHLEELTALFRASGVEEPESFLGQAGSARSELTYFEGAALLAKVLQLGDLLRYHARNHLVAQLLSPYRTATIAAPCPHARAGNVKVECVIPPEECIPNLGKLEGSKDVLLMELRLENVTSAYVLDAPLRNSLLDPSSQIRPTLDAAIGEKRLVPALSLDERPIRYDGCQLSVQDFLHIHYRESPEIYAPGEWLQPGLAEKYFEQAEARYRSWGKEVLDAVSGPGLARKIA